MTDSTRVRFYRKAVIVYIPCLILLILFHSFLGMQLTFTQGEFVVHYIISQCDKLFVRLKLNYVNASLT